MKIIFLIGTLFLIGCVTAPHDSGRSVPAPPYVEVHYDGEFLGAVAIEESSKTILPFEDFVDSGLGEKVEIGTENIAESFSLTEESAEGRLEVTHRWIFLDAPTQRLGDLEVPAFSARSNRSNVTLKAGSSLHIIRKSDGSVISGYDLDKSDGWRYILVMKESTEPDNARNGGSTNGEERSP